MTTAPEDSEGYEEYMDLVRRMSEVILFPKGMPGTRDMDPVMLACDIAAEVILSYPPEQHEVIFDILMTRLGKTLDRRTKGAVQ